MTGFDFGAAVAQKPETESQIDFEAYGRQVNLFLNAAQKREFDDLTDTLAKDYGTKNVTDTVMTCLRNAAAPIEF